MLLSGWLCREREEVARAQGFASSDTTFESEAHPRQHKQSTNGTSHRQRFEFETSLVSHYVHTSSWLPRRQCMCRCSFLSSTSAFRTLTQDWERRSVSFRSERQPNQQEQGGTPPRQFHVAVEESCTGHTAADLFCKSKPPVLTNRTPTNGNSFGCFYP